MSQTWHYHHCAVKVVQNPQLVYFMSSERLYIFIFSILSKYFYSLALVVNLKRNEYNTHFSIK